MTKTIEGVSDLLKAKLEALVDGDGARIIPEVMAFPSGLKTQYPSAEIMPFGQITTKRLAMGPGPNERIIPFQIKLYQEVTEAGVGTEEGSKRIKQAIDAVLSSFDTDKDLNNEIEMVMVDTVELDYSARIPNAVATFTVRCAIIITNV